MFIDTANLIPTPETNAENHLWLSTSDKYYHIILFVRSTRQHFLFITTSPFRMFLARQQATTLTTQEQLAPTTTELLFHERVPQRRASFQRHFDRPPPNDKRLRISDSLFYHRGCARSNCQQKDVSHQIVDGGRARVSPAARRLSVASIIGRTQPLDVASGSANESCGHSSGFA